MEVVHQVHTFDVDLKWDIDSSTGNASSGVRTPFSFSAPPEFGGPESHWSPEHLLAASIGTCYITTFIHFAKLLKVQVTGFSISCKAEFEKKSAGFEATKYFLNPVISLKENPGQDVLNNILEKAKKYCFISNSVKGEVIVNPVFNS